MANRLLLGELLGTVGRPPSGFCTERRYTTAAAVEARAAVRPSAAYAVLLTLATGVFVGSTALLVNEPSALWWVCR